MSTDNENTAGQAPLLESALPAIERLDDLMTRADDARISGLHNVLFELENLEEALASGRAARMAGLNRFEADETLERLEKLAAEQRTEFDAFDFIGQARLGTGRGLWGSEQFHSRVLAWLLDPKQSHGHGDRFLKDFLDHSGARLAGRSPDWSETKVIREWRYLDILIVNEAQQVLCAIENKVFSSEHSEQLTRYRLALDADYPEFTRYHVFLTRRGDLAFREKERGYWTPLAYSTVFDIVQQMLEDDEISTNQDVFAFLRQYATTLRRNIMPDTSVPQLARKIYLEHKEAIDTIVANKPDWTAEAKQWFKEAVAQRREWKLDVEARSAVRFRSAAWDRYQATQTGNGWTPVSKALLLFMFRFDNRHELPRFTLTLSPGSQDSLRQRLFEAAWQHPHLFKPRNTTLTQGWASLHWEKTVSILNKADYGIGWDDGATRAKVEEWVARFAENEFPAMNEVIVNCLSEHEAEEQS